MDDFGVLASLKITTRATHNYTNKSDNLNSLSFITNYARNSNLGNESLFNDANNMIYLGQF